MDDSDDILYRRGCLIGQINSVLCLFSKLDSAVKTSLLKTFCYSLYGCVLWDLNHRSIEHFCACLLYTSDAADE